MAAFLENIQEKYGSVPACVKQLFGFDDGDVEMIRANMLALDS